MVKPYEWEEATDIETVVEDDVCSQCGEKLFDGSHGQDMNDPNNHEFDPSNGWVR